MPRIQWLILGILLSTCSPGPGEPVAVAGAILRVGVLPDQADEVLRRKYEPLVSYLSEELGVQAQLEIPESYAALVQGFSDRAVDLAWFGGVSFCRAAMETDATPVAMRDIDLTFLSVFVVRRDSPLETLEETRGRSIAFGPRLSTSGHVMPRHFLEYQGIDAETFFSRVMHSRGHDQTVEWVRSKKVDVGAVNGVAYEMMLRDGRIERSELKVVYTTPPYQDYVWAVHSDLSQGMRTRLIDALLALDATNPAHAEVLSPLGAEFFLPAGHRDYDEICEAAQKLRAHAALDSR